MIGGVLTCFFNEHIIVFHLVALMSMLFVLHHSVAKSAACCKQSSRIEMFDACLVELRISMSVFIIGWYAVESSAYLGGPRT